MAADVVSPRLSFSHDLKDSNIDPVECFHHRSDHFLLEPTIDFDFGFCINTSSSSPAISSADELFSNGQIKKTVQIIPSISRTSRQNTNPPRFSSSCLETVPEIAIEDTKKKMLKDFLSSTIDDDEEEEEEDKKPATKPFWQFRRSSSLNSVNCENGRRNNSLMKSLQFLSRSNSTGSAPNPKIIVPVIRKAAIGRSVSQKEHSIKRSGSQKEPKVLPRSASVSSSTQFYAFSSGKKASLRKSYSNVIRINPVLNITPTYFTKGTTNLFGFCSSLFNSKSNKKKK